MFMLAQTKKCTIICLGDEFDIKAYFLGLSNELPSNFHHKLMIFNEKLWFTKEKYDFQAKINDFQWKWMISNRIRDPGLMMFWRVQGVLPFQNDLQFWCAEPVSAAENGAPVRTGCVFLQFDLQTDLQKSWPQGVQTIIVDVIL